MGKLMTLITSLVFLSGCSLDAIIQSLLSENLFFKVETKKTPDFLPGEIVTTSRGYQVQVIFGDISQKKSTANGYELEGVFYEN